MIEILLSVNSKRAKPSVLPTELIAGDSSLGYYGIVTAADFIGAEQMNDVHGFSGNPYGTRMPDQTDVDWLMFSLNDRKLLVATKTIRHSMAFNQLEAAINSFNTNTSKVKDIDCKIVYLSGGASGSPANSEWGQLMYRVSANDPTGTFWENLSNEDLGFVHPSNLGIWTWTPTNGNTGSPRFKVLRGGPNGVTGWGQNAPSQPNTGYGWRPVLELI
ncbi:hypothetical protein [Pseudomonas phage vB_PaeM_PS119XW]|uniref:Virion structural protein n=1 Tax=Pseudomonas phage vB_PaeM_PS119XW TaxID=2601632 RepID=A0A5C1K766_9CAUD|nr:virion structural protein [Pseudomonas phage vB_PaeM_PS119XW]QEM41735.1 hypothetical protein [Pseudomonas phage vB_PaeM_PS119XW]